MLLSPTIRTKRSGLVVRRFCFLPALITLGTLEAAVLLGCGQASIASPTCGTVYLNYLGNVTDGTEASQAETCFYQGFQHCAAVSIGLAQMSSLDAGAKSLFSVQVTSGGKCSISEADYTYTSTIQSATSTETCTGLTRESDGLLVTSCAGGPNVSIPAPAPTPVTPVRR
jgi:hypothetical protein